MDDVTQFKVNGDEQRRRTQHCRGNPAFLTPCWSRPLVVSWGIALLGSSSSSKLNATPCCNSNDAMNTATKIRQPESKQSRKSHNLLQCPFQEQLMKCSVKFNFHCNESKSSHWTLQWSDKANTTQQEQFHHNRFFFTSEIKSIIKFWLFINMTILTQLWLTVALIMLIKKLCSNSLLGYPVGSSSYMVWTSHLVENLNDYFTILDEVRNKEKMDDLYSFVWCHYTPQGCYLKNKKGKTELCMSFM